MASASAAEGDGHSVEEETKELIDDSAEETGTVVAFDSRSGELHPIVGLLYSIQDQIEEGKYPEDLDTYACNYVSKNHWPALNKKDPLWKYYRAQIEALIPTLGVAGAAQQLIDDFDKNYKLHGKILNVVRASKKISDKVAAQIIEQRLEGADPFMLLTFFTDEPLTQRDLYLLIKVILPKYLKLFRVVELSADGGRRVQTLRQLVECQGNVRLLQAIDGYTQSVAAAKVQSEALRMVKAKCEARATLEAMLQKDGDDTDALQYKALSQRAAKRLICSGSELPSQLLLCAADTKFNTFLKRTLEGMVTKGNPLYAKKGALASMRSEVYAAVVKSAAKANDNLFNTPAIKKAIKKDITGANKEAFKELRESEEFEDVYYMEMDQSKYFPDCVPRTEFQASDCVAAGVYSAEVGYDIGGGAAKMLSKAYTLYPSFRRQLRHLCQTVDELKEAETVSVGRVKGEERVKAKALEDTSDKWPKTMHLNDLLRAKLEFEGYAKVRGAVRVFRKLCPFCVEPLKPGQIRFECARMKNGLRKAPESGELQKYGDVKVFLRISENIEGVIHQMFGEVQFVGCGVAMLSAKSHEYYEVTRDADYHTKVLKAADSFKLSDLHRGDKMLSAMQSGFREENAGKRLAAFHKAVASADIGESGVQAVANWAADCGWPKFDVVLFNRMVQMKCRHPEFGAVLRLIESQLTHVLFQLLANAKHSGLYAIGLYLQHVAEFDNSVAAMLWPTGGVHLLHADGDWNVYHSAAYACALHSCDAERIAWLTEKGKDTGDLRALPSADGNLPVEVYIRNGGQLQSVVDALSFEGLIPAVIQTAKDQVAKLGIPH